MERKQQEFKRTTSNVENSQNAAGMSVTGCNSNDFSGCNIPCKHSLMRVDELEKTVKFLKEEQKRMLSDLHQEIASLQTKNRGTLMTH